MKAERHRECGPLDDELAAPEPGFSTEAWDNRIRELHEELQDIVLQRLDGQVFDDTGGAAEILPTAAPLPDKRLRARRPDLWWKGRARAGDDCDRKKRSECEFHGFSLLLALRSTSSVRSHHALSREQQHGATTPSTLMADFKRGELPACEVLAHGRDLSSALIDNEIDGTIFPNITRHPKRRKRITRDSTFESV